MSELYVRKSAWTERPKESDWYYTDRGKMYFDKYKGWFKEFTHITDSNYKPIGDLDYFFVKLEY